MQVIVLANGRIVDIYSDQPLNVIELDLGASEDSLARHNSVKPLQDMPNDLVAKIGAAELPDVRPVMTTTLPDGCFPTATERALKVQIYDDFCGWGIAMHALRDDGQMLGAVVFDHFDDRLRALAYTDYQDAPLLSVELCPAGVARGRKV